MSVTGNAHETNSLDLQVHLSVLDTENHKLQENMLELTDRIEKASTENTLKERQIEELKLNLQLVTSNNKFIENELKLKNSEYLKSKQLHSNAIDLNDSTLYSMNEKINQMKGNKELIESQNQKLIKELDDKLLEIKSLKDLMSTDRHIYDKEITMNEAIMKRLHKENDTLQRKTMELSVSQNMANHNTHDDGGKELKNIIRSLIETKQKLKDSEEKFQSLDNFVQKYVSDKTGIKHNEIDLKRQLVAERRQRILLEGQFEYLLLEAHHRLPVLNSFKEKSATLENKLAEVSNALDVITNSKLSNTNELKSLKQKIANYESNIGQLLRQRTDLANQIQFLLIHNSEVNSSDGPLSHDEMKTVRKLIDNQFDTNICKSSQRVISEKLVKFQDIINLQQNNEKLLNTIRSLADVLEEKEAMLSAIDASPSNENKEHSEAIATIKDQNCSLKLENSKLQETCTKYKLMLSSDENLLLLLNSIEKEDSENILIQKLNHQILRSYETSVAEISNLTIEIKDLLKEKNGMSISLKKEILAKETVEKKFESLKASNINTHTMTNSTDGNINNFTSTFLLNNVDEIVQQNSKIQNLESLIVKYKKEKFQIIEKNKQLTSEKEMSSGILNDIRLELSKLKTENNLLDKGSKDSQKQLKNYILKLEEERKNYLNAIESKDNQMKILTDNNTSQIKWYQSKIDDTKKNMQEQLEIAVLNSQKDLQDSYKKLEQDLETTKGELEQKKNEIIELNDRFTRLKKQANDRLNTSKTLQISLSEQLTELRKETDETKTQLDNETKKVESFQNMFEKYTSNEEVESLKSELKSRITKSDELDRKLIDSISSSEKVQSELNVKIELLEQQVKIAEEGFSGISNLSDIEISKLLEPHKKALSEENNKLINEKIEKLEAEYVDKTTILNNEIIGNGSTNLGMSKSEWEREYQHVMEKRIEYAEIQTENRVKQELASKLEEQLNTKISELESDHQNHLNSQISEIEAKLQVDLKEKSSELENKLQTEMEEKSFKLDHDYKIQLANEVKQMELKYNDKKFSSVSDSKITNDNEDTLQEDAHTDLENIKMELKEDITKEVNLEHENDILEIKKEITQILTEELTSKYEKEIDDVKKEITQNLTEELVSKYEKKIDDVKKKSFEDATNQSQMKNRFLERKISILEEQFNKIKTDSSRVAEAMEKDILNPSHNKLSSPSLDIPAPVIQKSQTFNLGSSGLSNPFTNSGTAEAFNTPSVSDGNPFSFGNKPIKFNSDKSSPINASTSVTLQPTLSFLSKTETIPENETTMIPSFPKRSRNMHEPEKEPEYDLDSHKDKKLKDD